MSSKADNTKLLRYLIRTRGAVCEFCGSPVICTSLVRRRNRIKLMAGHLTYWSVAGDIRTERIATVEHIQRKANGGSNGDSNVAVACYFCNQERNRRHNPKRRTCKHCGRPFGEGGGRRGRSCVECHRRLSKYFGPDDFGTNLEALLTKALEPLNHR